MHLRSTAGRTRLVFQPNGGNAGSNVTFTLCDGRGAATATTLVLANDGRLRAGTPTPDAAQRLRAAHVISPKLRQIPRLGTMTPPPE